MEIESGCNSGDRIKLAEGVGDGAAGDGFFPIYRTSRQCLLSRIAHHSKNGGKKDTFKRIEARLLTQEGDFYKRKVSSESGGKC